MLNYILKEIICNTFEQELRRHQYQINNPGKCFHVSFDLYINDEEESGRRWVEFLIYAPTNYVAVFYNEGWNIFLEDRQYISNSHWDLLSYHDSCWREDGVDRFLSNYAGKLSSIDFFVGEKWYSIRDVPKEIVEGSLWNKK